MPLISVIIPVYQSENSLVSCINSVLQQTEGSFEILLIDDGSTDQSPDICDNFAEQDSRIKVFHKENGGVSSARNIGLEMATGQWIVFLDSDDRIEQNYFSINNICNSDLQMQNWRFMDQKEYKEYYDNQVLFGEDFKCFINKNVHKEAFRAVMVKFYKRSIIEKYQIRFNTQLSLGEDTIFFLEYLSHCHSLIMLSNSTYLYYRPANWNRKKHQISIDSFYSFMDVFWTKYNIANIDSPQLVRFIYSFFLNKIEPNIFTIIKINSYPVIIEMKKTISDNNTLLKKIKYYFFCSMSKILTKTSIDKKLVFGKRGF